MAGIFDRRTVVALLSSSLLASRTWAVSRLADPPGTQILADVSAGMLTESPESATFLGVDKGAMAGLRHRLTDRTLAGVERLKARCADRLRELRSVPLAQLPAAQSADIRSALYAHELADDGFRRFAFGDNLVLPVGLSGSCSPYTMSQGTGFFAAIPDFLDSQHKVETADDAAAYLDRLHAYAEGLDGESERLRRDASQSVIAPAFILDTVIGQQAGYLQRPVADWGLVSSLAGRASKAGIAGDWEARARSICEQAVRPAIERQLATLRTLRTSASDQAGAWTLPDGDAYYRWSLKVGTTTELTPDEIHEQGVERVRSLNLEIERLLRANGMDRGTIGERLAALSKDPRQLYPDSDAGRAALLDYLNGTVRNVRARLPNAFNVRHEPDLLIKRVPQSTQDGAPEGYAVDGSLDGSRPASYYINLRNMSNWPKFTLPTLCFHEALPGHIWQESYTHELPLIRSQLYFNAYVEGWALYSEQLADELGMYHDDPLGRLGYLQSIQFRACRLVLDTGLHAKRWTRAKAIAWLIENNGIPVDSARAEIDRYCVWPGQACGYQIGQLQLLRLRALARSRMGSRFSLPGFHDAILGSGAVPFTILDEIVDRYASTNAT
jgi:uncharacterized protein (DUF885 family)